MRVHGATIVLGSFLLFLIQPILGKAILPWFGGAPAVWTACMLFFQVGLLGGYSWAGLVDAVGGKRGAWLHAATLLTAVLALPILPSERWKPDAGSAPVAAILALLTVTAGAPYFVLAASSPLVQAWTARADAGRPPYWMYALSNAASMLALVAYPFVIEPNLDLRAQSTLFTGLFLVFALMTAGLAYRSRGFESAPKPATTTIATPRSRQWLWLATSATGVVMLLATTNQICQEVAVVPFLWVLPLAVYLFTMILAFAERDLGIGRRSALTLVVSIAAAYLALGAGSRLPISASIGLLIFGLFGCSMVCHVQMVRLKPPATELVGYYRILALGGALGGVFVSLLAPELFSFPFELQLGLAAAVAFGLIAELDGKPQRPGGLSRRARLTTILAATALLLTFFAAQARQANSGFRLVERNFYGVTRTADVDAIGSSPAHRMLVHGVTKHGEQILDPRLRREPTGYYGRDSGVGRALATLPNDRPARVGLIGLGAGTLAAYGRPGDVYRFYEINPQMIAVAGSEFTFLRDSAATIEIVEGDARLRLEREPSERFDLLVVDAFTSDAIPIHLATLEAMALYRSRLRPGGMIAFNVSNRSLDFQPVALALIAATGQSAVLVENPDDEANAVRAADWILFADTPAVLDHQPIKAKSRALIGKPLPRPWTDRYSSLAPILK